MKEKVTALILEALHELGEDQENAALINADESTRLFGESLDSMGIVLLVTDLEALIAETFGVELTLADERAMSQKTSPFRSVKTLSKYVTLLLSEQEAEQ